MIMVYIHGSVNQVKPLRKVPKYHGNLVFIVEVPLITMQIRKSMHFYTIHHYTNNIINIIVIIKQIRHSQIYKVLVTSLIV